MAGSLAGEEQQAEAAESTELVMWTFGDLAVRAGGRANQPDPLQTADSIKDFLSTWRNLMEHIVNEELIGPKRVSC